MEAEAEVIVKYSATAATFGTRLELIKGRIV